MTIRANENCFYVYLPIDAAFSSSSFIKYILKEKKNIYGKKKKQEIFNMSFEHVRRKYRKQYKEKRGKKNEYKSQSICYTILWYVYKLHERCLNTFLMFTGKYMHRGRLSTKQRPFLSTI